MTTRAELIYRTLICAGATTLLLPVAAAEEPEPEWPETVEITGIVRDFKGVDEVGGHPDFENNPANGLARYAGNIDPMIGDDGKPVFTGNGAKITTQWRDALNRQISYALYDNFPLPGDVEGAFGLAGTGGVSSARTFDDWFRDVPVYNMSAPLTLTLVHQASGLYVFDDQEDPYYIDLDGFFPIDDTLFGNTDAGGNPHDQHNFHFTFEVHTQFQFDAALGQNFKFEGTDSVFLFIDGNLVNDLMGVHASHDQYVDLDRLGLVDGEWYPLDFFFAQRYLPASHFRIETNILLESFPIATVSAVFD